MNNSLDNLIANAICCRSDNGVVCCLVEEDDEIHDDVVQLLLSSPLNNLLGVSFVRSLLQCDRA